VDCTFNRPPELRCVCWNDLALRIPWPLAEADIVTSEKDSRLPVLRELVCPFLFERAPLIPLTIARL
jgi:hypothetical protein